MRRRSTCKHFTCTTVSPRLGIEGPNPPRHSQAAITSHSKLMPEAAARRRSRPQADLPRKEKQSWPTWRSSPTPRA